MIHVLILFKPEISSVPSGSSLEKPDPVERVRPIWTCQDYACGPQVGPQGIFGPEASQANMTFPGEE